MPRDLIRYHHSGQFHFLAISCYKRLPLLDRENAYSTLEQELNSLRLRYGFTVAGYVLMPEHVHLLTNEPKSPRRQFSCRS
jgi:putative transposase